MEIIKPIFIIGSGRSGTSILYSLLSIHPELGWFSNYSTKFASFRILPFFHRMLDLPLIGTHFKRNLIQRSRFSIKPSEAGHIYHDILGFNPAVKMTENDYDPEIETKFKKEIRRHLALSGKKRFLSKQTANTQRIRLIDRMFSDAYYIHIIRDGRAVTNSMLNVRWWDENEIWWLDGKTPSDWENQGREAIELCAMHWKRDVSEILENKHLFNDRYLEIKYEDLVADVGNILRRITSFCELDPSEEFFNMLPPRLPDMNTKWRERLTKEQKKTLERLLDPFLSTLGYLD